MTKIELALVELNELIDQGWEFPEAMLKVTKGFSMRQIQNLKILYDQQ